MRESILTIPVTDIFEPKCGCPICRLRDTLEQRTVEYIMGAAMMEPDVRMETNKLGFCKTHFEQMRACKNRLSLALMLQSHLQDMQKHIFTRKKMFEGKTAKQKKVSAVNNECFVCSKVDWGMSRILVTLFEMYVQQRDFRDLFAQQEMLCLPHYDLLVSMCTENMDKKYQKQFIDACHEAGMAVILDVVYNHATGNNPLAKLYWDGDKTAKNNPYFNVEAPHPYSVFHDFNHESPLVRKFVKRNLQFLLKEYKVDGFRFDLTKGFTQTSCTESTASNYDASRIAILKDYNAAIKEVKEGSYVILEHFCDSKEENELAADGMHLWRNLNNAYCQSAMGYAENSSFSSLYEKTPAWVGFMESHDEERAAYKQSQWGEGILKTDLDARMNQLALNTTFFLTVPGPKMVWQFGEMGYDISIGENGRTGRKPLHWEYLENTDRKELHDVYADLMKLRNAHPELFDSSAILTWKVGVSDWDNGRSLLVESVTGKQLVVMGNFTHNAVDVAFPATAGNWTNYFTGKSETINTQVNVPAHGYVVYTNF